MGESEPDYDPDQYLAEDRDDPCSYCDSPCEVCDRQDDCLQGPDVSYRPDYEHMKELCLDQATGTYPDLAQCQADYYRACKHCGYDYICDRREEKCPNFNRGDEP